MAGEPDDSSGRGRTHASPARSDIDQIKVFLNASLAPLVGALLPIDRHTQHRGAADIVEGRIAEKLLADVREQSFGEAVPARSKRSIEDFLLKRAGRNWHIDVKSRDIDGDFSMPNLVSIARLRKLYGCSANHLLFVVVSYRTCGSHVEIVGVEFHAIEEISWTSLAIQNLGLGQIQIRNAKLALAPYAGTRDDWVREFFQEAASFYDHLAAKAARAASEWRRSASFLEMGDHPLPDTLP